MKSKISIAFVVISTFFLIRHNLDILQYLGVVFSTKTAKYYTYYGLSIALVLLVSGLLYGYRNTLESLGLNKGIMTGMAYGFLFTLPMFLGYAVIGELRSELSLYGLILVFIPAAMEEVVYRGFLFGQLFRKAKWGFIPAVMLNALIFGMGHLYQGSSMGQTAGVFMVTLMGGIWFAWLYIEWDNNLWIAIGLHFFMNLSCCLLYTSPSPRDS